jgi:hypothetical protein
MGIHPLAFYCVCDRSHFLGLVALINSLRLLGHDETIYVLDCGLTPSQLRLIEAEAVVEPAELEIHPMLLKNVLPIRRPAETMIVVDVDVLFTRQIHDLADRARKERKPIFFLNDRTDRFHREWENLGYGAPVPHEYITTGHYVLSAESSRWFLELFEEALHRLDLSQTLINRATRPQDPFYYPEMDVLNALVGTAIPMGSFLLAERDLVSYWPFGDLRVEDEKTLDCRLPSGSRPALLHHILDKPWITPVPPNPYIRLMTRLLSESDVAIQVPKTLIPWRLRSGATARLLRQSAKPHAWFQRRIGTVLGATRRLRRGDA